MKLTWLGACAATGGCPEDAGEVIGEMLFSEEVGPPAAGGEGAVLVGRPDPAAPGGVGAALDGPP